MLGGSGGEVARLWRLKQLEYSFRLTAMGQYEDFRWVTSRALDFALASTGVSLPGGESQRLAGLYDHLPPFPDAIPALRALAAGAMSSRSSPTAVPPCRELPGQQRPGRFFGQRISVDEVRAFQPSPLVYRHAAERLARRRAGPARHLQRVRQRGRERGRDAHGLGEPLRRPFDTIGTRPDLTVPPSTGCPAALAS